MRLLPVIFLIVIAAGCKQASKIPDNFDYGTVKEGVYRNTFFEMEIPLIPKWNVQSKEEMDQIMDKGIKDLGKTNKKLASQAKASQVNSAKLLIMFRDHPDFVEAGEFNPSFMLLTENIRIRLDLRTGADYLDEAKKMLKQARPDYQIVPGYTSRKIGNREFDVMRVSIGAVTQLYCCTVEKGFALTMILSFADDEQEEELANMLRHTQLK